MRLNSAKDLEVYRRMLGSMVNNPTPFLINAKSQKRQKSGVTSDL